MKKNLLKFVPLVSLIIFTPLLAFAQTSPSSGLADIVTRISNLFKAILPVLVSLGVLYFVWGMVQYFIADGEEAKKTGRDRIIYGIIGLAVIVALWGLVGILNQTFGLGEGTGLVVGKPPADITNLVTVPASGSACNQLAGSPKFSDYLDYGTCLIGSSVIPFIFAVAVVMFIWGAVKFFIINADEEAKRAQGKQFMLWGIIALTVMISIWGLVNILGATFNLPKGALPRVDNSLQR